MKGGMIGMNASTAFAVLVIVVWGLAIALIIAVTTIVRVYRERARRRKEYEAARDKRWEELGTELLAEEGNTMVETAMNNVVVLGSGVFEIDPEKRYCIEIPGRVSDADLARINHQWKETLGGKHNLLILCGDAKIAGIQEPDDPDHNPDA